MIDDIVTRLRYQRTNGRICQQAADEIERQRTELEQAWNLVDRAISTLQSVTQLPRPPIPAVQELIHDYIASERSVVTRFQRWDAGETEEQ